MNERSGDIPAFYKQFIDAKSYLIAYPSNDHELADWDDGGDLIDHEGTEWTTSNIKAVHLGDNRYKLAEKIDWPFSEWKLEWGEEFLASIGPPNDNTLILRGIVMPPKYVHEVTSCILETGGWRGSKESTLIHEMGGGWEYALGVLTISIPAHNYPGYRERLTEIENCGLAFRRVHL